MSQDHSASAPQAPQVAALALSSVSPSAEQHAAPQAGQAGKCLGRTKAGGICNAQPTGDGYCPHHSPRFNADQRRTWAKRGAAAKHGQKATQARAALVQEIAATAPTLPPGVELPPVPTPAVEGAPDWSSATLIREYLQRLAVKVIRGEVSVSVSEALRKLADSTRAVVDLEMDSALVRELNGEDDK